MVERERDLDRFYALLGRLEAALGGKCPLRHSEKRRWPDTAGVYFLFEPGEHRRESATASRVVRIGSSSRLRSRLEPHMGTKARMGRLPASALRKHVRSAILSKRAEGSAPPSWAGECLAAARAALRHPSRQPQHSASSPCRRLTSVLDNQRLR